MKRNGRYVLIGWLLVASAVMGRAQQEAVSKNGDAGAPPKYFHLDFVLKEVEDGRVLNSRNYSTTVNTDAGTRPSIRAGSKIAFPTSGSGYMNFDVGVNIDCRDVQLAGSNLQLAITAEVSSAAPVPRDEANPNVILPPVVRSNKWTSPVVIPLRKPTTVFSSDDVATKRKLQLEVTATPIL